MPLSHGSCGGHRVEGQRYAVPLDWSQSLALGSFYDTILKPALEAVGLPASRPATPATTTAQARPAVRGVRVHDLRHTAAVLYLSAGVHFMRVSQLLGHATYTVTLDTYGDTIGQGQRQLVPIHVCRLSAAASTSRRNVQRQVLGCTQVERGVAS